MPFDELDSRTIDYALKTSVQNADEIFDEIERSNAQTDKQAVCDKLSKAMEQYALFNMTKQSSAIAC